MTVCVWVCVEEETNFCGLYHVRVYTCIDKLLNFPWAVGGLSR